METADVRKGRELRGYLTLVKQWLWFFALCATIGGGATFIVSSLQRPVYRATALLIIDQRNVGQDSYSAVLASNQLVSTYASLVVQPSVLQVAAQRVGHVSAADLTGRVHASGIASTQLVQLQVDDTSPTRAAALANAIGEAFITIQLQTAQAEYNAAQQQLNSEVADVSKQISQLSNQMSSFRPQDPSNPNFATLQQQLNVALAHRSTLQTVAAQLTTQDLLAANNIRVFQSATPPKLPDHPKPLLYGATGAAFGLVLAAGIVFLGQFLDDRVRTAEDVENLTGLPSLATLAVHDQDNRLLTANDNSRLAESFRILRTNLSFAGLDRPIRSIVVTSSLPQEGKTTAATNLAISLAFAGKRVLLVDADLRRPSVHKLLGIENGPGLSLGLLVDSSDPRQSFTPVTLPSIPNLLVLTAGPTPPNPTDLLASERMQAFIRTVLAPPAHAGRIDVVVFDTPPAVAFADASVLAGLADTTILVIDAAAAHERQLLRGFEALTRVNARVAGVVLNRVKQEREDAYYYAYDTSSQTGPHSSVPTDEFVRAASTSQPTQRRSTLLTNPPDISPNGDHRQPDRTERPEPPKIPSARGQRDGTPRDSECGSGDAE